MNISHGFRQLILDHLQPSIRRSKRNSGFSQRAETLESREVLTAPDFTSPTAWNVVENDSNAAVIEAADPDGDPLTYFISGSGADDALFTIDGATGELTFRSPPDAEHPLDANGDNVYQVDVEVHDFIDQPTLQSIEITVIDIDDETPVIVATLPTAIDEGQLFVGVVQATDADASSVLTYSLTNNGQDNLMFTIDSTTGEVNFKFIPSAAAPADFDGDSVYDLEVEVSDGFQSTTQAMHVTVLPVTADPILDLNGTEATFNKKLKSAAKVTPNLILTGNNNFSGGGLVVSISNVNTGKKRADKFNVASLSSLGTVKTELTNNRYVTSVNLKAGVTGAQIQSALRQLTFATTGKGLKFATRDVHIQVFDGNFAFSNDLVQTINVRKK